MKDSFINRTEVVLRSYLERLNTDVLFECFAGLMWKNESLGDKEIHVIPIENFKRNFRNDIVPAEMDPAADNQVEHYFDEIGEEFIVMYTSRQAILDYLPEDLFSDPVDSIELPEDYDLEKSEKAIKNHRNKAKKELESAQRFFRPLEIEYNKLRIQRELDEVDQLEDLDPTLKLFWNEYPVADDRWKRFVRTLHLVTYIIGDPEKTKALIEYVLELPVSLSFETREYTVLSKKEQERLFGEQKIMGFNVLIGSTVYDYQEICVLKLALSSNDEFFRFFDETSTEKQLLNEIIKNYFPLNTEIKLDFTINPKKDKTTDDAEEKFVAPVLGYSSRLGG